MKKNGFTLIELLAVILILIVLAMVVIPVVTNKLNDNYDDYDEATRQLIYRATDLYIDQNPTKYENIRGDIYCVEIENLISSGFLKEEIKETANGKYDLTKIVELEVESSSTKNYVIKTAGSCVQNFNGDGEGPIVSFSPSSGSSASAIATDISAYDIKSGLALLEYVWTSTDVTPSSGYASFENGSTLTSPGATGNYYLHIRATDEAGNVSNNVSGLFEIL